MPPYNITGCSRGDRNFALSWSYAAFQLAPPRRLRRPRRSRRKSRCDHVAQRSERCDTRTQPTSVRVGVRSLVGPAHTPARWTIGGTRSAPLFVCLFVGVLCRLRHGASPPSLLMCSNMISHNYLLHGGLLTTLGGLLCSAAEGEVSCVVVEPSPSTSAGAVAPSLESIGTTCCDAAGSTTAAGHTGG